jgi:hypothetical protein
VKTLEKTTTEFTEGARVCVREEGIAPWFGVVRNVKWSAVSGWWLDVTEDGTDNLVWIVKASDAELVS